MVRFHRDKWYSMDGMRELRERQTRNDSTSTTKLFKLCALLALVLIIMWQLSNEAWVDRWFAPFEPRSEEAAQPTLRSEQQSDAQDSSLAEPPTHAATVPELNERVGEPDRAVALQASIWEHVLGEATHRELNDVGIAFFEKPSTTAAQGTKSAVGPVLSQRRLTEIESKLQGWKSALEETDEKSDNREALDLFLRHWPAWSSWFAAPQATTFETIDGTAKEAFSIALDRWLLKTLRDGSPWRNVENAAFRRSLDLARSRVGSTQAREGTDRTQARLVEILSLLADMRGYRGEWVRFRGTLASEPTEHRTQGDGAESIIYWIAWLKPTDGSTQPVCVYLTAPLAPFRTDAAPDLPSENSILEVEARVLKMLAYAAQQGVDVAPVLMASRARWIDANESAPVEPPSTQHPQSPMIWKPPTSMRSLIDVLEQTLSQGRNEVSSTMLEVVNRGGNQPMASVALRYLKQLERYSELVEQVLESGEPLPESLSLVQRKAIVIDVQPVAVASEHTPGSEAEPCFRLTLQRDVIDDDPPWYAYARRVPSYWRNQRTLFQPIQLQGMRIGGQRNADSAVLISKFEWNCWPEVQSEEQWVPPLPPAWLRLARSGWDLANIDRIADLQTKPFATAESRAFYSLLRLCSEGFTVEATSSQAMEDLSLLLTQPNDYALREVDWSFKVIRVARVYVREDQDAAWLGQDHYYQIDGMAETGKLRVTMKGKEDEAPIVFEGKYPVTLVVATLPDWLEDPKSTQFIPDPSRNLATSDIWYPKVDIRARGIFYRLWGYTSQAIEAQGPSARQFSPLVFATAIQRDRTHSADALRGQLNWLNAAILVLTAAILVCGWLFTRSKVRKQRGQMTRREGSAWKLRQQGTSPRNVEPFDQET